MCVETIDGVLVVQEGAARLRWRHEPHGTPPLHADDWVIGELWPSGAARASVLDRIACREPVLVVLDNESPVVVLPTENVPVIPSGAMIHNTDDDLITLSVPALNWLEPAARQRGHAFAATARALISQTPRFLLPPVLTETSDAGKHSSLKFVHTTGSTPYARSLFPQMIRHLFAKQPTVRMRSMADSF